MGYVVSRSAGRMFFRLTMSALTVCGLMGAASLAAGSARAQTSKPAKAQAQPAAQSLPNGQRPPLVAVISTGQQRITIYDRNGVVAQSPVSSGRKGFESPEGVFSILEKKEDHFSNVYEDGEMPFMQRLTWSGVAMHAGHLPGYPASHGCIRLPYAFAERFYDMTRINMRVVVVPNDTQPMPIMHPALFKPGVAEPASSEPASSGDGTGKPAALFRQQDGASEQPMMLGARLAKPAVPEMQEGTKPQKAIVTPLEAARAQRAAAIEKAVAATKAADAAKLLQKTKLGEIPKMQRAANAADVIEKRAWNRTLVIEKQIGAAKNEEQLERTKLAHAKALEDAAAAAKAAIDAKATLALRQQEMREVAEAVKAAEQAKTQAHSEARAADRLTDPVSVLVSRRTGKLYIRQGRHAVTEMPVAIKDFNRPIGTLVFTAMSVNDGSGEVVWRVVAAQPPVLPAVFEPQPTAVPQSTSKSRRSQPPPQPKPVTPSAAALGAEALDRVTFSQEALARITPYLQAGSSLIISDLAPSIETGAGTDFIIQTRGEEQAVADSEKRAKEAAAFKAGEKWARELVAERQEKAERAKERALERASERAMERGEKPPKTTTVIAKRTYN